MNEKLKQKLASQLKAYAANLSELLPTIQNQTIDENSRETTLNVVHKIAGLYLTFHYMEEGETARYVEIFLKDLFAKKSQDWDNNKKNHAVLLVQNLITTCHEVITQIKGHGGLALNQENKRKNASLKGLHILVVDDDPVILLLLQHQLTNEGCQVSTAEDGLSAIDISLKQMPDIIVMDKNMPNLNGFEAAERIHAHEKTKHIPIFILTASDTENMLKNHSNAIVACLEKPLNIKEFQSFINLT